MSNRARGGGFGPRGSPRGGRGAPPMRGGGGGMNRPMGGGSRGGMGGFQQLGGYGGYDGNGGSNSGPPFKRARQEEPENHILLMTVENPIYPINVSVIQAICKDYGQLVRVVIFKKSAVQALVEFDSIESAREAKRNLQGADIYSGCCTLNIEYGKPSRLTVKKNDSETFDFSNPNLPTSWFFVHTKTLLFNDRRTGFRVALESESSMRRGARCGG